MTRRLGCSWLGRSTPKSVGENIRRRPLSFANIWRGPTNGIARSSCSSAPYNHNARSEFSRVKPTRWEYFNISGTRSSGTHPVSVFSAQGIGTSKNRFASRKPDKREVWLADNCRTMAQYLQRSPRMSTRNHIVVLLVDLTVVVKALLQICWLRSCRQRVV